MLLADRQILRFLVLFFLLSGFAVQAQQNRSSVSGFVFGPQRMPVAQIPIELLNELGSVIQRARTDASGKYSFRGLSHGRFSLRVLPLGTDFEEQTLEIEIAGIGALGRTIPDNVQKDVYLRPRKKNNAEINAVLFAQDVPAPAQAIYERAVSALDNGKIEEGVKELEKALGIFPDYYSALERLGLAHVSQKNYEKGRDAFSRAVSVNQRSFNAWYGLSYTNYALRRPEAAAEAAGKAVLLNPESAEALLYLGISQRELKRYEEAEKALIKAEKLAAGRLSAIHWNLALLYAHNLNRYRNAADQLESYLKAEPDAPNKEIIKKLIKQFREKK